MTNFILFGKCTSSCSVWEMFRIILLTGCLLLLMLLTVVCLLVQEMEGAEAEEEEEFLVKYKN